MFLFSGLINLYCFPLFSVVCARKTSIDFWNSSGSEDIECSGGGRAGSKKQREDFLLLWCGGMRLQLPAAHKKKVILRNVCMPLSFEFLVSPFIFLIKLERIWLLAISFVFQGAWSRASLCVPSVQIGESREKNMQEDGGEALTLDKRRQRRGPVASDALFHHFRWFIGWCRLRVMMRVQKCKEKWLSSRG